MRSESCTYDNISHYTYYQKKICIFLIELFQKFPFFIIIIQYAHLMNGNLIELDKAL